MTDAERRAAASDAELNSLKSNALHQHAQFSYMKQFEKFSKEHLDIDVRLKVLEGPLAVTGGEGGGGGGGDSEVDGSRGGGRGGGSGGRSSGSGNGDDNNSSNACNGDSRHVDSACSGPSALPPVQDSDGLRHRATS